RGSDRPGRGDWIDRRRARHLRQAVHLPQGLGPPAFRVRHGCPRGRPSHAVPGTGRGGCAFEKVGSGRLARVAGRGRGSRVPHRRRAQDSRLGPDVCDLHAPRQRGGGGRGLSGVPFKRGYPGRTGTECRTGNAPGRRPWPPPTNNAASGPVPVLAPGYVPAPPVGGEGSYAVAAALLPPGISPRASVVDPRGRLAAALVRKPRKPSLPTRRRRTGPPPPVGPTASPAPCTALCPPGSPMVIGAWHPGRGPCRNRSGRFVPRSSDPARCWPV